MVHRLQLEIELYRRTGRSFQDFFELIMQKHDCSFLPVKPMGREGDWKADGFSTATGTVYQCYAPEQMTARDSVAKLTHDFHGAREHWREKMRSWVFVWSAEKALPPQVVALLEHLKGAHPEIAIGHMGREGLWEIVRSLEEADRVALLGVVPEIADAPQTTAAEIQVLMRHLGKHTAQLTLEADLDLTAIGEKLSRNGLSGAVDRTVRPAVPVAKLVRDYVTHMPDPAFSEAVALDLAGRYREFASASEDADVVFGRLVDYVLGEQRTDPKFYWAAAGIVTHYFELCEIFER